MSHLVIQSSLVLLAILLTLGSIHLFINLQLPNIGLRKEIKRLARLQRINKLHHKRFCEMLSAFGSIKSPMETWTKVKFEREDGKNFSLSVHANPRKRDEPMNLGLNENTIGLSELKALSMLNAFLAFSTLMGRDARYIKSLEMNASSQLTAQNHPSSKPALKP